MFPMTLSANLASPIAQPAFIAPQIAPQFHPTQAAPRLDQTPPHSLHSPSINQRLARLQAFPNHMHMSGSGLPESEGPSDLDAFGSYPYPMNDDNHNGDIGSNMPQPPGGPNIDSNGVEVLDCDHVGHFVTADGYPVDIFLDKAMANKDLSDINAIYDFKFSLNHDDRNGHRTIHVSDHFPSNESLYARMMRDTIYGQWVQINDQPVLDLSMHVNDNPEGKGPSWESGASNSNLVPPALAKELSKIGGEMRKNIFKNHVQDSLQAMALGTQNLLSAHPQLKQAQTQLRFLSNEPSINETVGAGTVGSHLEKPLLDKKNPLVQISKNIHVWGDAMRSSSKAMKQLFNAVMKPETLGPLLQNPKTLIPTLALLASVGLVAAHNRNQS